MPQISVVGTGGDYSTLAAWESAEAGSDYGAGNPAIAEITGSIAKENITGAWAQGFIIRAKAGEEAITGSGTAVLTGGGTILIPSTASTNHEINDLTLNSLDVRTSNASIVTTANRCAFSGDNFARHANCTMRVNDSISTNVGRGFDATSGADAVAVNNTIVGVGSGQYGFVRWKCTDCFVYADAGSGYIATLSGSDYNASDDTSSPGANSLDNRTTADFADYAGGDYRTASGSALATSGSTGGVIGYLLETGGGTSITATKASKTHTSYVATVNAAKAIDATKVARTLSTYAATVKLNKSITATKAAKTHTTYNAQVTSGSTIAATVVNRTISVHNATVQADVDTNITATKVARTYSIYNAVISTDVPPKIDGASSKLINTNGGQLTIYFNGTDYFEI